jgi:MoaA/NifB/PqqE/SkfB family radical SAM enzyme
VSSLDAPPPKPLKAYLNILKMRMNMALKRPVVSNYPMMAMIEPSLACNLRCPACPTGLQLGLRPAASLAAELFYATIDEIGDYVFYLSMYNWGEPLLHKETPEFIAYAKQRGMTVKLSTNLSLNLSDDYVERLVRSGLDEVLVGLDGTTPETYERYRRRGEFALVRDNMVKIQATKARLGLRTPHVTWQFLVFRHNEHEIEDARARYREWGADGILVGGAEMPTAPHAEGFAPSTLPAYNRYHPDHPVQVRDRWVRNDDKTCSWLYGIFVMNPNGQVSPCCATADEKDDFGTYQPARGFFDLWNGGRFRQARVMFKTREFAAPAARPRTASPGAPATATDELICHRCPIVYLQDRVHVMIGRLAYQCLRQAVLGLDPRSLLAFVLMGGPSLYAVRLFVRKLIRGEDVWKHA